MDNNDELLEMKQLPNPSWLVPVAQPLAIARVN